MIQYAVDTKLRCVVCRMSGEVTFAEFLEWQCRLYADREYAADFACVAEMRGANLMLSHENLKQLVAANADRSLVAGQWACLVDAPGGTALAMLYQTEKGGSHRMSLFSTEAAASAYLGMDVFTILARFRQGGYRERLPVKTSARLSRRSCRILTGRGPVAALEASG